MNTYTIGVLAAVFSLVWMGLSIYARLAGEERSGGGQTPPAGSKGKVLILTAAVGGGHEAAGRTVGAELEGAGYSVAMADGLRTMSRVLDWVLVRGYMRQVRGVPRTLSAVFVFTSRMAGAALV